jgi:hypothetical protein
MDVPLKPPLEREEQPSVACPHCAAHTGQVKSVATDKGNSGVVNITMLCRDCRQSWMVQKLTHEYPPA